MSVPSPDSFDDPTSRTRMAWNRTLLTIAILGALLLRAILVFDRSWEWALVVVVPVAVMLGLGLARLRVLAKRGPAAGRRPPRRTIRWELAGVMVLATLAVIFVFV